MTTAGRRLLRLDRATRCLRLGIVGSVVTQRAFELVELLAVARVLTTREARRAPVTVEQIGSLPAWRGSRSAASLRAQIRREIKNLRRSGLDIVGTPPRCLLAGPFWLNVGVGRRGLRLEQLRSLLTATERALHDPVELIEWLDSARRVCRSFEVFDKPNQELADGLDADSPEPTGRICGAMASLNVVRRAREVGQTATALRAASLALAAAQAESDPAYRTSLIGWCHLHEGWTHYREDAFAEAARCVAAGLRTLEPAGQGHLRVRGKLLALRSFLSRRDGRLTDALRELWSAAECSLLELDMVSLVSVYHNLSVLLEELARTTRNSGERSRLLELAVECARKNIWYCQLYEVGRNSVLNRINLARLLKVVGQLNQAIAEADTAFSEATDIGNRIDAARAHCLRLSLRLEAGLRAEADALHREFVKTCDPATRRRVTTYYRQHRQAQRTRNYSERLETRQDTDPGEGPACT